MKPLPVVLIGAGHLGRIHAKLLGSLGSVRLVAVAEPCAEARQQVETERKVRTVSDYREVMGDMEAAIVATPTVCHFPIASDLLRSGIHVFCEKPLTPDAQQADQLTQLARQQGLILQVGHVERFNPAWQSALRHLKHPRYIEATRQGTYTFRSTDVSIVLDLMIHDIDLVLSIVRSDVIQVQAFGAAVFGPYEDFAHVRLSFANGCAANLTASRVRSNAERSMEVITDDACVSLDFAQRKASLMRVVPAARSLEASSLSFRDKETIRERLFNDWLPTRELPVATTNPLLEEQIDFVRSVRNQTRPVVSGEDARDALAIADRIIASIRTSSDSRGPSVKPAEFDSIPFWPADTSTHDGHRKAG